MTSQVSSPAGKSDEASEAVVGEQRAPHIAGAGGTEKEIRRLDRVIIRFAGDSGDGMQLTGDRFTSETASFGNDLSTLPNFPAEIRAPAGTLPGVSSFQLHFADHDILTPGDAPNVLVAMNPAALKANIADVPRGADIIVNTDEFTKRPMAKVGYAESPLEDGSLEAYNVHPVPLTTLTIEALKEFGLSRKEAERSKNMFALGLLSWMYNRPTEGTEKFLRSKFARKPEIAEANVAAFRAGWNFGETTEDFAVSYEVAPASQDFPTGTYRNISGNLALSYGLIAAGRQADLPVYLGSYPITPASDILHELSKHKNFGVRTFQAEDEIAGIGAALGASFGGSLGVTTTSGPGVALKSETIGLAVSLELPLLIIDIQRGGPSTGLPTKTEQADLLQAMYGRNGEAPVPIVAPRTPADCFDAALDAARIALTYRTPVFLLSDGYLANGSEPWRIPEADSLPDLRTRFATGPNHELADGTEVFWPYKRDPETLARPWAVPGTPGLEHRIGGIEKQDGTGNISYDPANHDFMVRTRQAKIDGIRVPDLEVDDPAGATTLVLGWGSTYGPITAAVRRLRAAGETIAQAHLRHLNPFPANLGEVLRRYDKVVVPEMNLGQLALLLRAKYLVDAQSFNQVNGMPFKAEQLATALKEAIDA
ncbi:2-oxoacid:acceptor oxidoreductase subunit alpha [Streptomyces sp. NPDC053741]|uniref:Pyruvate flavodoxin/ferredoxin oxidoreductase domain protein n=2 Tax=Streptomyces TaxID=1883 RepID=A0A8D3WFD4_STRFA|nr:MULTISPECIES: 2-oxoacid:acceptor oxidoreductase subunit alpha [Streptomyces]MBD2833348.1 2-oxoacid:acceptor oxidoreductase subunit alpha [Streptomyces pratensis]MYT51408.1 2-oxoacid:acceptor oxidoreductase subunit alpha [Streptomyces sp. SID7815]MYT58540.1 2-oxoacid:acceptor oxidoreductase subunit alpha [Streptomyces sp. SID7834]RAS30228.1 2-oxoglutarate ferredoxin oxidoreductase subunit alpha [Streptomyces avidinii]TPN27801.1 2-oxoacid:acceptor oxidoreductase subunit alpha [Mesorhizobium s